MGPTFDVGQPHLGSMPEWCLSGVWEVQPDHLEELALLPHLLCAPTGSAHTTAALAKDRQMQAGPSVDVYCACLQILGFREGCCNCHRSLFPVALTAVKIDPTLQGW